MVATLENALWKEENPEQPKQIAVFGNNFNHSRDIGEISDALVKAQLKFEAAAKGSQNPAYRSKYADLNSILEAIRKPLNEEGIAILQPAWLDGQMVTVTTRLQHKSGQFFESSLTLPAVQRDRFDAQTVGSAITYGRRYGVQSLVCIGAEDDDGNAASGVGTKEAAQAVATKKIAELKAKKEAQIAPSTLFFTYPERHQGNYAEFVNIKEYAASLDPVAAEGLRKVFAPHLSKNLSKTGVTLIPKEHMKELLETLVGNCGIDVSELKPGPGEE